MPKDVGRLKEIAGTLERDIDDIEALGLDFTAELLRIAKLDLLMRIHGISEEELQAFGDALSANYLNPENKIIHLSTRKR